MEIQGRRCRDKISLGNSANSGLIAGFREPSTQSLSNRSLASDPPRQFCDQMSLSDKTLCRKDWHSGAIGAVLSVNFGRQGRPEILPRRLDRRGGASVVRRDAAKPNGGSQCQSLQRSDRWRQRQPLFQRQNHCDTVPAMLSRRGPIAARSSRAVTSADYKIYVDASVPATLNNGTGISTDCATLQEAVSTDCATLQEAVLAWQKLAPEQKIRATVGVIGGRVYTAQEIERLHYGAKPA